jgi:anaerobic selenocysteine-containing dehydrogenase
MAWIETRRGRIRQRVRTTEDIMPGVAGVDYGWWFPEKSARDLYGWADANANILTDDSPPYGAEMGTPCLRGFLCKITRA